MFTKESKQALRIISFCITLFGDHELLNCHKWELLTPVHTDHYALKNKHYYGVFNLQLKSPKSLQSQNPSAALDPQSFTLLS